MVDRNASYSRYRKPSNWLRSAPLVVKNVSGVPSGPTNVNGPVTELLAATWNATAVLAGVVASKESAVHVGVVPAGGLASLIEETNVPDDTKPPCNQMLNPASVLTPPVCGVSWIDQTVPLVAPVTRVPPGYTSAPMVEVPERVSPYVPGEGLAFGCTTNAYCVPPVSVIGEAKVAVW